MNDVVQMWDMVFVPEFPESVKCTNIGCRKKVLVNKGICPECGKEIVISNVVAKQPRPVLIYKDQINWYKKISFGIPLSTQVTGLGEYEEFIGIDNCLFYDNSKEQPRSALINQVTRFDGDTIKCERVFAYLNNKTKRESIRTKLYKWVFGELFIRQKIIQMGNEALEAFDNI